MTIPSVSKWCSHMLLVGMWKDITSLENWKFLTKLNMPLSYEPRISSIGNALIFLWGIIIYYKQWLKTTQIYNLTFLMIQESKYGLTSSSNQGLTELQSKCQPGWQSHLRFGVLSQDYMAVYRIHVFCSCIDCLLPLSFKGSPD